MVKFCPVVLFRLRRIVFTEKADPRKMMSQTAILNVDLRFINSGAPGVVVA